MDELLQRVLAEPTDLTARMVYGDALVEAGDPRGELVSAQCTLASAGVDRVEDLVDVEVDEAELARLAGIQRHVQQLAARYHKEWLLPLELPEGVSVKFRRGMPEAITIDKPVDAVPLLERLAKLTPIGELTLRQKSESTLRAIAAMPLPGLRALDVLVGGTLPGDLLEAILRPTLRRLRLAAVDVATIDRLAQLPALRGVQHLDLSWSRERGAAPLVRLLDTHRDLVITARRWNLDDAQLHELVAGAPHLRGLDVRNNPLSIAALRELVALPRLRFLGFDPERSVKHDKTAVGRAIAKGAAPLRSLALGGSINGPGLAAIAASPRLADVRAIDLTNDRPGDIGAAGNAALAAMKRLVMLDVRGESLKVGIELMKLPTLAYFDCQYFHTRKQQKQLAAHYGDCVPAYEEREPTYKRGTLQRLVEVPDDTLTAADVAPVLRTIPGIAVEMQVAEWIVRDPKVVADPIGVSFKKLPGKPRYLTMWYWPEDAQAWASRLDEIAAFVANECGRKTAHGSKPTVASKVTATAKGASTKVATRKTSRKPVSKKAAKTSRR